MDSDSREAFSHTSVVFPEPTEGNDPCEAKDLLLEQADKMGDRLALRLDNLEPYLLCTRFTFTTQFSKEQSLNVPSS